MLTSFHPALLPLCPLAALLLSFLLVRLLKLKDRPGGAVLATGLLAALWPLLTAGLVYLNYRTAPEEMIVSLLVLLGLPSLVLAFITAASAARRQLKLRPGQALLFGLVGIVAGLVLLWPAYSTYFYALGAWRIVTANIELAREAREARPVLAEYGIQLPPGYRAVEYRPSKARGSFVYAQHGIVISSDDSGTPRQPLIDALLAAGYREIALVADAQTGRTSPAWINEPFLVDIRESGGSPYFGALELALTRDDSGRFLGRLIPAWNSGDSHEPAAE